MGEWLIEKKLLVSVSVVSGASVVDIRLTDAAVKIYSAQGTSNVHRPKLSSTTTLLPLP